MTSTSAPPAGPPAPPPIDRRSADRRRDDETAARLLTLVETLVAELHPSGKPASIHLGASLERDLGIDSLGRVELVARIERDLGVRLPDAVLGSAETPRDLLAAVLSGGAAGDLSALHASEDDETAGEAAPARTRTLLEVLAWHAERHPERRHLTFYPGDEATTEELSYGELRTRARRVAAGLQARGVAPGDRVALMLPSSTEYFAAFLGVQLAGAVPVPLYPPVRRSQIEDHLRRQAAILRVAGVERLIAFPEVRPLATLLRAQLPTLREITTVAELAADDLPLRELPSRADDIAFLQFTSGSTGNPKGVVLTHANLLANLRAIGEALGLGPHERVVSWLPLYHDMGLIGAWMGSLYFGMPLALMPPLAFLARPARWLWTLHHHRGTTTAAPNFAYELCVRKVQEAEIEGLDLSSCRLVLNGAEPVSPETLDRFATRFAPYGFRREALLPVYGLAESSLAVTFPAPGKVFRVDAVDRAAFATSGEAVPASPSDPRPLRFVGCGRALPGHEVRVADEAGNALPDRRQGRVQFRGPSASSGYYRDAEATAKLVREDGWRDSGDLGYQADGHLHVTGRAKDVIIRGGVNIYPHELEERLADLPGVRRGCVAVFGAPDPETGTERIVVLAESATKGADADRLREAILAASIELLGSPADDVVLVPPHSVPKTSSGKLRRSSSRDLYVAGHLGRHAAPLWLQVTRLALGGFRPRLRIAGERAVAFCFTLGMGLLLLLAAVPVLSGLLLPTLRLRRRWIRGTLRATCAILGAPLRLGGPRLPAGPAVYVANHASYLDGFLLAGLLPADTAWVIKREMAAHPVFGALLRRIDPLFVERFERAQAAGEAERLVARLRAGESVGIFPEGTFHRSPGLRAFRLGAFAAAATAGVPVVPVALRGTRGMLPDKTWLLRPVRMRAEAAPALVPDGDDLAAAVRLREAARSAILERTDEGEA